jgi:hypothetical protein
LCWLLVFTTNIRPDWKGLLGTNALTSLADLETKKKRFYITSSLYFKHIMIVMTIVKVMPHFEASLLELPITFLQPSFTLPKALFMMLIVQVYDHHLPSLFMNIYNKDY